jgi:hypothetical protein
VQNRSPLRAPEGARNPLPRPQRTATFPDRHRQCAVARRVVAP